MRKTLS